nr:MAG TPA: hypothetical protein [Caudoviricetes sp.]
MKNRPFYPREKPSFLVLRVGKKLSFLTFCMSAFAFSAKYL